MARRKSLIYKNDIYYLQTLGRYYQRSRNSKHPNQERLLHRVVWVDHFGPIPEGKCVHHIDGNWRNNSISNLELMGFNKHAAYHLKKRWTDPDFRKRRIDAIPNFVKKSLVWHRSKEGRKWHSQNGFKNWDKRKPNPYKCEVCSKPFLAFYPARFCSTKCSNKFFYPVYFDVPRKCVVCGKDFMASRYTMATHCSKSCTTTAMWNSRKGLASNATSSLRTLQKWNFGHKFRKRQFKKV